MTAFAQSKPARRRAPALLATVLSMTAAHAAPVSVVIDARHSGKPVTPYEYGMFIEPIGNLIARSLWAEMLDDRKFFYPILAPGKDPPAPLSVEGRPGITYRKWRPIGGDDAVIADVHDPYVGKQSARVVLNGATPRGFGQGGLGIAKGKTYVGHLLLSGDSGAKVQVALLWGPGADARRIAVMPVPSREWQSVPFEFTAGADSTDAHLEITGTGTGEFRVGVISLMPADNINGWRADTTAILRSLHSGMWRLPGGNFLSNWDWHGAIGPRDKRAPMFDHAWSAMQPNDLGMDEYMELTRIIGVEPYVTVNAGLGDANSAAEEVEYLNGSPSSEWGAKRAANGHPAPYNVRFWNIGNEPYGWWQIGKTTLDYFMMKHNEFAAAMRAVDPSITLIGSGAMPDQLHPRDARENASLESIRPKFGTEEDWTGGLLAKAWGNFDGLSEHWYDRAEKRPGVPAEEELIEFARSPSNQVRMKAEEWGIYRQRFPAMNDKPIFLSMDEFAYTGAPVNLKLALAYAMVLQEMLRHTDFMTMGAFTTGASTMDITQTDSVLNSTGEVFKLYGDHFGSGTQPLRVDGDSPQPEPKHPVGFNHPRVRAGSPTYPLDVVAGLSPERNALLIAVVNATLEPQSLAITLSGVKTRGSGRVWRLTGENLESANNVGQAPGVRIQESRVQALSRTLTQPPISASIYEFPATVTTAGAHGAHEDESTLAQAPPMGWNSWDAYGLTIDEAQFKANASVLEKLAGDGWRYAVIDEGWYMEDPLGKDLESRHYVLDANGLLIPAPSRFPSSAGNQGFRPLADWLHARGLAFGLHIVRGIPKAAVMQNLPIADSPYRAAEAADRSDLCPWDDGNYGVVDNAAGQAYYDAVLRRYAQWGVDFVKVDCIADHPYRPTEIRQIATAIRKTGRPIVLSLSPGPTQLSHAADVARDAQMWRIANDVWDGWTFAHRRPQDDFPNGLRPIFDYLANWAAYAGPGHWPDADMLPFGSLSPRPGWGEPRRTRLTNEEERSALTLWSIARSPLILGGNLTQLDTFTRSLITHRPVLEVNQTARSSRPLAELPSSLQGVRAWLASVPWQGRDTSVIAVFNVDETPRPVHAQWAELGVPPGAHRVRDLWSGRVVSGTGLDLILPAHGCAIYRLE